MNAAFLDVTCKSIDFKYGKSNCRTFRHSTDSKKHDGVRHQSRLSTANGVEATSPHVHWSPLLTFLLHGLHDQIARRQLYPDLSQLISRPTLWRHGVRVAWVANDFMNVSRPAKRRDISLTNDFYSNDGHVARRRAESACLSTLVSSMSLTTAELSDWQMGFLCQRRPVANAFSSEVSTWS